MRPFEYANPQTEAEALELLNEHAADTAVLAGGTDLINLMKRDLATPTRVVDLKQIPSLRGVTPWHDGLLVGALTTLEDIADHPILADYRSMIDVVDGVRAIQIQQTGTVGGDLCHLPNCWYFRNGYGLLGMRDGKSLVAAGDNRYHAILGNRGPAKFVNASRFAPALIAWNARVRIVGPSSDDEEFVPLEYFYVTPKTERQGVTILKPGQLVSHIWLPPADQILSGTYEVLTSRGLDWPTASAAASVRLEGGLVKHARIVMGHVAPVPWVAEDAAGSLIGAPLTESTAEEAGRIAVAGAQPLSKNAYKIQQAQTAVKRALLRATGQLHLDV